MDVDVGDNNEVFGVIGGGKKDNESLRNLYIK